MSTRSRELTDFLHTLRAGLVEGSHASSSERRLTDRVFGALERTRASPELAAQLSPVCVHLDTVVKELTVQSEARALVEPVNACVLEHASAIAAMRDQLLWWRREGRRHSEGPASGQGSKTFKSHNESQDGEKSDGQLSESFFRGHANATVIGKGGLEESDELWIGISLLAPNVEYPEHHHPPEEAYLVLSRGQWQQSGGLWHEPGPGAVVHNPPNVLHAMRSGSTPLLATWCLWLGER